jgi:protein-S-isoprenylcysteine O-methyltransferase Ste14
MPLASGASLRSIFENLALIGCAVYATIPAFWLSLHPFAAHWRTRGRNAFKTLLPLWMLYTSVVALALSPWRHREIYVTNYAFIPGAILVIFGLLLYRVAGRNFTPVQLSGLAEVEPDRHAQRLVTTGIRSRIRHPIYLGHLCELLGWTIAFGTISLFAIALFAVATGAIMIHLEDDELEARFGDIYQHYRQRVPAILPRIF